MVAIGFRVREDLSRIPNNIETFKRVYEKYRTPADRSRWTPRAWKSKVATQARQLREYTYEMMSDHLIITYGGNRNGRIYLESRKVGDYVYDPTILGTDFPHIRKVEWSGRVIRDNLSKTARKKLGRPLTLFKIDEISEAEFIRTREA